MTLIEIFIVFVFVSGLTYAIILIARDPIYYLKAFLRALKPSNIFIIVLFPIWFPIWIADKIFDLKIYIKSVEDDSKEKRIEFKDFNKYVIIESLDKKKIEEIIDSFINEYDPKEFNYSLENVEIRFFEFNESILLVLSENIGFKTFNMLVYYLSNGMSDSKIYVVKGLVINKFHRNLSYFIVSEHNYDLKLTGKDYKNKKLYVEIIPENNSIERVYYNPSLEYVKNFNFDKFINDINNLTTEIKAQHTTRGVTNMG
jgi:hypothetical protein